jgi:pentalenic acid synthase
MNTAASTTAALPPFPMASGCPCHPPAGYGKLREEGPLARVPLYDGRPAWVVTGYAETRQLLVDPWLSSS